MSCYLKYDNSNSKDGECVFIEYVYEQWENGYCSKSYLIHPSSVYFEDASFTGFSLEHHLKEAERISQKKFDAVQNMIANCRQELDCLGMTGVRVISPEIKAGEFYFVYSEDIEEGIVEEYWSCYYKIISVDNGNITYQYHIISENNLERDTEIHIEKQEDFLNFDDMRWYKITEDLYNISVRKIDSITEDILKRFRKS